jgi:hypothetical protein
MGAVAERWPGVIVWRRISVGQEGKGYTDGGWLPWDGPEVSDWYPPSSVVSPRRIMAILAARSSLFPGQNVVSSIEG